MTKLGPVLLIGTALSIASCSQSDMDRARSRAREAKQEVKSDLDEANRKLKEGVQKADDETGALLKKLGLNCARERREQRRT